MDSKIIMPWEERPEGCSDVMWRYSKNPVIGRYHIPSSNSIFNSAVVPFGDGFAGVFRCDNKSVQMNIFAGFSKDVIALLPFIYHLCIFNVHGIGIDE